MAFFLAIGSAGKEAAENVQPVPRAGKHVEPLSRARKHVEPLQSAGRRQSWCLLLEDLQSAGKRLADEVIATKCATLRPVPGGSRPSDFLLVWPIVQ